MNKYYILTDDRKTRGTFTKWAEVNDLYNLKIIIEYFKKLKNPADFIIYDTEKDTAWRLIEIIDNI